MNTFALFIGVVYAIITLVAVSIIIFLIIKRRKRKKLEDFERRDN